MRFAATVTMLGLLATSAPLARAQASFDDIWKTQKKALIADGINEQLARRAFHWMKVQYFLGRCQAAVGDKNATAWRDWWRGTNLVKGSAGPAIVNTGNQEYARGARDGAAPPSICTAALGSLDAKMSDPALGQWEPGVAPLALRPTLAGQAQSFPAVETSCTAYIGKQVSPQSFDAVAAVTSKVPTTKDEFETTDAFNTRQKAAVSSLASPIIIGYRPNLEHLKYDADRGALTVSAYVFRNLNTSYSNVFGPHDSPYDGKIKYGFDNIDVVVGETEKATGTYKGTNAYGAIANVTEIKRSTQAIWEREARSSEKLFVDEKPGEGALIGSIPMQPEQAKLLKTGATAALVVAPQWPYFATGNRVWSATIARPTHVDNDITVLTGDIQCALLLDASKHVVAAFITR